MTPPPQTDSLAANRAATAADDSPRPRLFGTDGIRGRYGEPPLDEETVRRVGAALGEHLRQEHPRPRVVLGGDTRFSTPEISRRLVAELGARGIDVIFLGTVPTPAVADVTRRLGAACGIAVSASHNPAADNGIKLIDADGFKWPIHREAALETRMQTVRPVGGEVEGEIDDRALDHWVDDLLQSLGEVRLEGLRVALDAGNGAASPFARRLFEAAGAEVAVHNADPDGRNINRGCGSTHPEVIAAAVSAQDADLGFTFDGDADRCLLADAEGVRDGDAILYLWALDLHHRGELPGDAVVATSMSNLGLEVALRSHGIDLVRCDVGDRHVVATLQRRDLVLGGEQSGHMVHLGLSTTGDGLLTALQVARIVARRGRSVDELLAGFERYPQLLKNVEVGHKPDLDTLSAVVDARRSVESTLGDRGRLVLRYSGTEPKVRIMIEGEDRAEIESLADELALVLEDALAT